MNEVTVVVVFDRPSKENGHLWACVKCVLYQEVDYTCADPEQMYDHMQRHHEMKHSVPGGIFTQIEEALRIKVLGAKKEE